MQILKTCPSQYFQALNPKTIEDVIDSDLPTIGTINKKLGLIKTRAALAYLISDALEFFNATNTMKDTQIATTVDLLIEEYPYFNTADFKLALKNAMKMKYGEIYNRIDGHVIMGWMKEYNKERCNVADMMSYNEHKRKLHDMSEPITEGVSYDEYIRELEEKAKAGDEEASRCLELSRNVREKLSTFTFKKI